MRRLKSGAPAMYRRPSFPHGDNGGRSYFLNCSTLSRIASPLTPIPSLNGCCITIFAREAEPLFELKHVGDFVRFTRPGIEGVKKLRERS
jgi:hypothetical protein